MNQQQRLVDDLQRRTVCNHSSEVVFVIKQFWYEAVLDLVAFSMCCFLVTIFVFSWHAM